MNFFGIDNLTVEDYRILKDAFEERSVAKNQLILGVGEPAAAFYFIASGRVRIFETVNQQEELLAVLSEGMYFGEQAIIEQTGEYAYSASTLQATDLLVLTRERFTELMQERLSLGMKVILSLTKKFRETYKVGMARQNQLYAFFGPKGGAGCTTVACNFAFCLGELTAKKVLLVDLNPQYGDAQYLCRPGATPTISRVFEEDAIDIEVLRRVVSPGDRFDLLAAPEHPEEAGLFNISRLRTLLGLVVRQYDYVLLDLPATVDEMTQTCWDHANFLFIIVTPTFSGLVHLQKTLKICERKQYPPEKVKIVFNRYDEAGGLRKEEFARFLQHEYVVFEEDAKTVLRSNNGGTLFAREHPLTVPAESMRAFARSVVLAKSPAQRGGVFTNLKRLLLG